MLIGSFAFTIGLLLGLVFGAAIENESQLRKHAERITRLQRERQKEREQKMHVDMYKEKF